MKAVVVAFVVVFLGCDNKPADPKLGAGSSVSAAPSEIEQLEMRLDRTREELRQSRDRARKEMEERLDHARGIGRRFEAPPARRCPILHTMADLVTKLSGPRNAMSHDDECKAIRELKNQSEELYGHLFIDLELDDIVDGRCGPKVRASRDDVESFYAELHSSLAEQLRQCRP